MNISRGLYRLAQVIKWGGRVLGGLWFIALLTGDPSHNDFKIFVGVSIVFVVITEGIAWVLEGFAND